MEIFIILIYLALPVVHYFADKEIEAKFRDALYFSGFFGWAFFTSYILKIITDPILCAELVFLSGIMWAMSGVLSGKNTEKGN